MREVNYIYAIPCPTGPGKFHVVVLVFQKRGKTLLSSKFHTDTIPVRDNNNDTAYAIACSLEAARPQENKERKRKKTKHKR